jgi:cobalt/nickel transport system permease protein
MARIDTGLADIGWMDALAGRDTPLHRLDPRAKLLTTLAYILAVLSFGRYEIAALLPFVIYPVVLMILGEVPAGFVLRKVAIVSPFAIFIGIFNPLFDRHVALTIGPLAVTGGWLSFVSILQRFALTLSTTLVLVAGTGIHSTCRALERLGVPQAFTVQVLVLYRYLFVLMDEGARMVRARALRSFGARGSGLAVYGHMLGSLLLRTLDRAQRIHLAMNCRGFDGRVHTLDERRLRAADIAFLVGWSAAFMLFRLYNVPHLLGALIAGGMR